MNAEGDAQRKDAFVQDAASHIRCNEDDDDDKWFNVKC